MLTYLNLSINSVKGYFLKNYITSEFNLINYFSDYKFGYEERELVEQKIKDVINATIADKENEDPYFIEFCQEMEAGDFAVWFLSTNN